MTNSISFKALNLVPNQSTTSNIIYGGGRWGVLSMYRHQAGLRDRNPYIHPMREGLLY